jgi:hypothetical protein
LVEFAVVCVIPCFIRWVALPLNLELQAFCSAEEPRGENIVNLIFVVSVDLDWWRWILMLARQRVGGIFSQ